LIAALGVAALVVAACLPAPATAEGHAITDLWTLFAVAAACVGALVWGLITFALLRYRRSRDHPGPASDRSRAVPLEIAWTVGPIILVAILFGATLITLSRIDAHEPTRTTVAITAFRWQWRFDYPGTGVSVSGGPGNPAEMVVPVGEPIHFVLDSADVIHSFYVPAFLFKRDAIPGRQTEFDFTIDTPGSYRGQCAEFCGVQHDRMLLTVRAVSRSEFDAWLADREAHQSPGASAGASR
jgi:cytochrome c oxidase subunit 2